MVTELKADYGVLSLLREGVPVPPVCLLCTECVLMNARPCSAGEPHP